ncbi:copine-3-like isoform X1 [Haliotis rubra]|uniref:copine-3-like isoform X1 n=1 Tax=Haliotis rubra TaxID=36100 RepID=UPI001EE5EC1E|nr:copine-3-like isoform X1 [Haliotis rubra]
MAGLYPPVGGSTASQCVTKVELRIECKNLKNKDVMSKSDPCAVLFMQAGSQWKEVGRTENVVNSLDPVFVQPVKVDYYFEQVQKVKVAVYDVDNKSHTLEDDDFLGQIECTLGQLVSQTPYITALLDKKGGKMGQSAITVKSEEIKAGSDKETVNFDFRAAKLDNKDTFGKSDPYLEILKKAPDGTWQVVHRTEVVKNTLNPNWRQFSVSVHSLCGGDRDSELKIDVYDWDSDGSHDLIGGFTTSLNDLLKAEKQETSWPCINPKKKAKKKNYTNSGIVMLSSIRILIDFSFLDFIMGGTQINLTVGVDFTASNGDPRQPNSLHYFNQHQPTEYAQAIQAVGNVVQDYDSDKLFPALGFGAQIPPNMEVSFEFAMNFNAQNPFCAGIPGVLQAYYNCVQNVRLYGPTNAAPIINHIARFAASAQQEEPSKGASAYYILLLLTDGEITDMDRTTEAVVNASSLPMSIIIIGVGGANFDAMNFLDGDDGVLKTRSGQKARRDIVQFVAYRDFKKVSEMASAEELARNVLAEVPRQVTGYYKMRNIQPRPRAPAAAPPTS